MMPGALRTQSISVAVTATPGAGSEPNESCACASATAITCCEPSAKSSRSMSSRMPCNRSVPVSHRPRPVSTAKNVAVTSSGAGPARVMWRTVDIAGSRLARRAVLTDQTESAVWASLPGPVELRK